MNLEKDKATVETLLNEAEELLKQGHIDEAFKRAMKANKLIKRLQKNQ